ncbi:hypothetical protein MA16_Dca024172 [Dendrobium catenatum]|uniref:Holocarboxylase synthetase n=2 Tax=Dendrobium catenatum TaxID=906689 RepID=A0A2I0X5C1_9ASPA|nr:hypothetical protein MA16_Dca024172 [Dendrobium catenatum]
MSPSPFAELVGCALLRNRLAEREKREKRERGLCGVVGSWLDEVDRRSVDAAMAKKRKSDASRLDEVDRTMYSTFCSAANSLSQIYTQAMSQQKVAFQAGERHGLEKLYQWIIRQHEGGSRITLADIVGYLQNEIDDGGHDSSTSPRLHYASQHPQATFTLTSNVQTPSGLLGSAVGFVPRSSNQTDQSKNSVFSNALSSPVRQSLQRYHLAQGDDFYSAGGIMPPGIGARNSDGNREANSHDSTMDMHSDSPAHDSY